MEQQTLYDATLEEAIKNAVAALGGSKHVGCILWPDKNPQKAQELLNQCLNPDRKEKLDLSQFMLIQNLAKKSGCHAIINFQADELGYSRPQPIEPKDELAELQKQFIQSTEDMQKMLSRIGVLRS